MEGLFKIKKYTINNKLYFMKKYQLTLGVVICLLLSSCIREDVDLSQCYRNLRIELDWIDTQPRDAQDSIDIAVIGKNTKLERDLKSDQYGTDIDLLPYTYDVVAWEPTANINIDDRIVSLSANSDGTPILPTPFSGGMAEATVDQNIEYQVIHVPMRQQTRKLIIQVKFLGDGFNLLEGLEGSVDGLTFARDINESFPPADGRERPSAIKNTTVNYKFERDSNNEWFVGGNNLLGVNGDANQTLYLHLLYSTDDYRDLSLDITSEFLGFHTVSVHEPWYIVITLDLSATFDPVIVDWQAGSESWLDAQ